MSTWRQEVCIQLQTNTTNHSLVTILREDQQVYAISLQGLALVSVPDSRTWRRVWYRDLDLCLRPMHWAARLSGKTEVLFYGSFCHSAVLERTARNRKTEW